MELSLLRPLLLCAMLSLSGIVSVGYCMGSDDGHVEMDGFLERLSARIDGRETDEPLRPLRPPPASPPAGSDGVDMAAETAKAFAETVPRQEAGREPDLIQRVAGSVSAGVREHTIDLVDLSELQKSHGDDDGGGHPSALPDPSPDVDGITYYAGIGPAQRTRIKQATLLFNQIDSKRGTPAGALDGDEEAASSRGGGGRKKRRGGGKDNGKTAIGATTSPSPPGQLMGSSGYPPRQVQSGGVAVQHFASGPARPHYDAHSTKAERQAALDDSWRDFNSLNAPTAAHQWQDEGTKVVVLVQISAVDMLRTTVDIRRDEVRVMTWNIVDKPARCHITPLYGTVAPKLSFWEVGERGGIDITLHKRDPDVAWPHLMRTETDPVTLGRIPVPQRCQFNNPILAPVEWARRLQQQERQQERRQTQDSSSDIYTEGLDGPDADVEVHDECALLQPESVFYAEDSPAMRGVSTWMDELHSISYPHRLSLAYPDISSTASADGDNVDGAASSESVSGEREIGKIFGADGGPELAQQRVHGYLLGRGVNDTQAWASWTQLGNTWRALGNPYRAVQCFRKAVDLKGSDDPDVLLNLGLVVQHAGHVHDALVLLDQAVALAPRGMLYRYIRATLYDAVGNRKAEALAEYKRVKEITPQFVPVAEQIKRHTISTLVDGLPFPLGAVMQNLPWLGDLYWLLSGGELSSDGVWSAKPERAGATVHAPVPQRIDIAWPINMRLELRYSVETCVAIVSTAILVFFYVKPFEAIFDVLDRAIDNLTAGKPADASADADGRNGSGGRSAKRRGASSSGVGWTASTKNSFGAVR